MFKKPVFRKLGVICIDCDGRLTNVRCMKVQCGQLIIRQCMASLLGVNASIVEYFIWQSDRSSHV